MIKLNTNLDRFAVFSGGAVSLVGVLGLLGWVTGVRELASIRTIYLPVSPDTSLVFMLLGLIVSFIVRQQYSRGSKIFVSTIVAFISFYGLLKFTEYFLNIDLTLENILLPVTEKIGSFTVKRMSPLTGILFFLSGISLQIKMIMRDSRKVSHVISSIGMITMTIGFIAIIGYLYGTPLLYGGKVIPLAALTAIGFLLLGCGLMSIAGPKSIFVRLFVGSLANARLLRVLIPLIVAAILIQGLMDEMIARLLNINVILVTALLSLIFATITAGVVIQLSRIIFRRADEAEAERRQAEEKNLQLASIIEFSDDAIIGKTLDGVIISWNTSAERMYGYTKEQAVNQPISLVIPHDHQDEMMQILDKIRKGEHIDHYETVRQRKDGTHFNVSVSISPMFDVEGTLIGASTFARDITDRKRAEDELRKLSLAVEQSPASIVITDTKGTIEYVNPKFIEITGYSLKEAIGKNPRILKSGEKPSEEYKQLWDMITSGNVWRGEFHNKKKNGELYWESAIISPIIDAQGVITHFLAVKEDITQRKQVEEALLQSEEKFRAIFENNSSAIAIIERDTTISMVNDAYCQMSGYTRQEVVGMSWTQQIPPEDLERLKEYNRRRLIDPQDAPDKYEFKFYKKNGELRYGLMSVSLIQSNRKIVTSFLDITERRQVEVEREKLIDELKTALNDVKTLSGLLPICSSCKKIRDDNGYWQQVEGYIQKHSDATFTHGICPDCMVKLYPEYQKDKQKGLEKK